MNDYERMIQRAIAAETALRWLAYNFEDLDCSAADETTRDDATRLVDCIHTYSAAGADAIRDLIDALQERDGHQKEENGQ